MSRNISPASWQAGRANWLPMILVMSFRPWGEAYGEVRTNLFQTLVQRLQEDGMLRPAPDTP
jgi:hypothetical protein